MYQAVLSTAIADACRRTPLTIAGPPGSKKSRRNRCSQARIRRRETAEAREWLTGDSEDFRLVCDLAFLDAGDMRARVLALSRNGWWRQKKPVIDKNTDCLAEDLVSPEGQIYAS